MPRERKKKPTGHWTGQLDETEIRQALEEACVDAYDQYEQHAGLLTMIEDQVAFPFPGRVMGEEVQVVDMAWPEDDEFGLDLVCERNGRRHRVEAQRRSGPSVPRRPSLSGGLPGLETDVVSARAGPASAL